MSSLALAPSGDIVAAGYAVTSAFTVGMGVARYHANGVPDATFGNGGVLAFTLTQTGSNASVGLVEPDGRIVLAGYGTEPSESNNQPYFIDYYFGLAALQGDGDACASHADCGACESCNAGKCVFGPRSACTGAEVGGGSFTLDNPGIDLDAGDRAYEGLRMKFKWRGSTPLGFDPTTTDDVGVCLYSSWGRVLKGVAPAGRTCGSRPCWSGTPGGHFGYRDASRSPNGIAKIRLTGGRARIDASGFNLTRNLHSFPNASLLTSPDSAPLLVQVHGGGACFQAALTDVEPTWKPIGQGSIIQVGLRGTGQ